MMVLFIHVAAPKITTPPAGSGPETEYDDIVPSQAAIPPARPPKPSTVVSHATVGVKLSSCLVSVVLNQNGTPY